MRLGIGSYSYPWAVGVAGSEPETPLTAFGLLARARALGVDVVQIADNLPLDRLSASEVERLRAQASEAGITLELGTRGIDPALLDRHLTVARTLGVAVLRTVIDTATHHPGEDEVLGTLREVLPAFERAGVCLALENHDRFPARTLARLVDRLDSPCAGICLDTANSLGAGEGIAHVADVLAPHVVNLHVKDVSIARLPHLMGFVVEGRPAGSGMLDLPSLVEAVRARARPGTNAVLELWPPPEASLPATLRKEEAWVEASLDYLRRHVAAFQPFAHA